MKIRMANTAATVLVALASVSPASAHGKRDHAKDALHVDQQLAGAMSDTSTGGSETKLRECGAVRAAPGRCAWAVGCAGSTTWRKLRLAIGWRQVGVGLGAVRSPSRVSTTLAVS